MAAIPVGANTTMRLGVCSFNRLRNVVFPVPAFPVRNKCVPVFSMNCQASCSSGLFSMLFTIFGKVTEYSFSFVLIRKKKNQKERIKAAFFRLLRCFLRLKGRNSLRSNSLPFLTPEKPPALDVGKTRPGGRAGGTV